MQQHIMTIPSSVDKGRAEPLSLVVLGDVQVFWLLCQGMVYLRRCEDYGWYLYWMCLLLPLCQIYLMSWHKCQRGRENCALDGKRSGGAVWRVCGTPEKNLFVLSALWLEQCVPSSRRRPWWAQPASPCSCLSPCCCCRRRWCSCSPPSTPPQPSPPPAPPCSSTSGYPFDLLPSVPHLFFPPLASFSHPSPPPPPCSNTSKSPYYDLLSSLFFPYTSLPSSAPLVAIFFPPLLGP